MSLRAIFAGTPDFAAPSLHALLLAPLDLLAVYTQPDRPAGRGRKLRPSPIRKIAADAGLTVRQPTLFSEEIPYLAALEPDLLIVVAYGLILPQAVLDIPRHGCINVHASLLPRWRGAAPIQRAIEAGDHETGISLMRINEQLDSGDILTQVSTQILSSDTSGTLHQRLADLGAQELIRLLPAITSETATAQDHEKASYAEKIQAEETYVDWHNSATVLERKVRAFNPRPLCRTRLDNGTLLIRHAIEGPASSDAPPGTIIEAGPDFIRVQTGQGTLDLIEVQSPGRKPTSVGAYLNGHPISPGQNFNHKPKIDAKS